MLSRPVDRKSGYGLGSLGDVTDISIPTVDYGPSLAQLGIGNSSSGINWGGMLNTGVNTGLSILKDIYGGPQPGTYIRTPQGGIYERLPEGSLQTQFSTFPTSGGSSILVWGALGIGVLFIVSKMGSKN